jgi:predicted phosphoadenosine phosphosulfate sulfurtransferase
MNDIIYNFYPLYDWTITDVWAYNAKFNKDYKLYDLFYKASVNLNRMRIDETFGNAAKAGLSLFKVIEPQTWSKVVNRVSEANFGNIYHGNKIMNSAYTLPKNHTWKSFTKFLLKTLPVETQQITINTNSLNLSSIGIQSDALYRMRM